MSKIQAVVLGRNYTSLLSMTRAAGEAGCDVTIIKTVKKIPGNKIKEKLSPEFSSKYVVNHAYAIEPDSEGLVILLQKMFKNQKDIVLLPTDDFVASAIDLHQEELKSTFLFPNINHMQGAVVHLMDKDVQKEMARNAGLNVAEGWVTYVSNGSYEIPNDIIYPVFTKPQISFYGNKKCMKCCKDEKELREVLNEVAVQGDCPILIEQYIEIEKEYGVLGYCDTNCVITPSLVDKVEIGNGAHKGVTMVGKVSPFEETKPEIYSKIQSFLKSTGFVGLIDIDLYESKGIVYFNELNLRLGAFGHAALCAGINMPGMLIETLLGHSFPNVKTKMDRTITCISEKVAFEDYADGFSTKKIYKKRLNEADYMFIKSENDGKPYSVFKLNTYIRSAKKLLKFKK